MSILANILLFIVIYLPAIATILNIVFLRRMLYERQDISGAMLEVRNELRTAAQRSNRKFKQVSDAIQEMRIDMQYNHEVLTGVFNSSKSNYVGLERPLM